MHSDDYTKIGDEDDIKRFVDTEIPEYMKTIDIIDGKEVLYISIEGIRLLAENFFGFDEVLQEIEQNEPKERMRVQ